MHDVSAADEPGYLDLVTTLCGLQLCFILQQLQLLMLQVPRQHKQLQLNNVACNCGIPLQLL
jgi:hypothetical protein